MVPRDDRLRLQSMRTRLRAMVGMMKAGPRKRMRAFLRFDFCELFSECTSHYSADHGTRERWLAGCVCVRSGQIAENGAVVLLSCRHCFCRRFSCHWQVIINATSTLISSAGTLSDFKLSIQAPKTFIVTPTAFSGTASAPRTHLVVACSLYLNLSHAVSHDS